MLQRTLLARLFDLKPFILLYNLFEIIVDYTDCHSDELCILT